MKNNMTSIQKLSLFGVEEWVGLPYDKIIRISRSWHLNTHRVEGEPEAFVKEKDGVVAVVYVKAKPNEYDGTHQEHVASSYMV
jgi:hypothetical protein